MPRKDGAIRLKYIYLELQPDVKHKAPAGTIFADGDHKRLLNLGPITSFIK